MKIIELIHQNDELRKKCLNMIVSENVLNEKVKEAIPIQHSRYQANIYGGTEVFHQIYKKTQNLAKDILKCESALITPLSGFREKEMVTIGTIIANILESSSLSPNEILNINKQIDLLIQKTKN